MLFLDDRYNLSIREMEMALLKAGLPLDPQEWDDAQFESAQATLDLAQIDKIHKARKENQSGNLHTDDAH